MEVNCWLSLFCEKRKSASLIQSGKNINDRQEKIEQEIALDRYTEPERATRTMVNMLIMRSGDWDGLAQHQLDGADGRHQDLFNGTHSRSRTTDRAVSVMVCV